MTVSTKIETTFSDLAGKDNFEGSSNIKPENKKGEPYGESAMFNYLPPGHDIDQQEHSDIRALPAKAPTTNVQGFHPFGSK